MVLETSDFWDSAFHWSHPELYLLVLLTDYTVFCTASSASSLSQRASCNILWIGRLGPCTIFCTYMVLLVWVTAYYLYWSLTSYEFWASLASYFLDSVCHLLIALLLASYFLSWSLTTYVLGALLASLTWFLGFSCQNTLYYLGLDISASYFLEQLGCSTEQLLF